MPERDRSCAQPLRHGSTCPCGTAAHRVRLTYSLEQTECPHSEVRLGRVSAVRSDLHRPARSSKRSSPTPRAAPNGCEPHPQSFDTNIIDPPAVQSWLETRIRVEHSRQAGTITRVPTHNAHETTCCGPDVSIMLTHSAEAPYSAPHQQPRRASSSSKDLRKCSPLTPSRRTHSHSRLLNVKLPAATDPQHRRGY